ncbi:preprotein translocase subunit SecE [Candidatus Kaiserbacteria bacterium RIFCSPLOWO2_12_FULL_52_8]|uniref:Protein translocase subunit SecE n=1 Tax=Candidatus Kaiserbacteria bacterium RIFCSPHIGHO2_01_FULL_53_31 TaxID=1798481 RepID=A0A1F6CJE9_9BACT|nr:MAG: preprotein translocase subunit SecE [Candidatus Kaiserbacteria bacterium RIFCSPHIGHO2_01_FULL_53_31]OGG92906.1 MAG: preprotein translocase subunit SecE [Candidatus Kaiserbacteria bacterium RIFCSPLOWO2_12_FULL_52_8]
MNALITYLKNVRQEFTHIVWPSRHTAIAHTLVVVIIAMIITVLVGVLDYVFGGVVSRIVGG